MCGIAGYAGRSRSAERAEADLGAMCAAIRHRGPDEEGHHVGPGVALGMRRLSVIDVLGGSQPIANERGDVHVVFNGEIYNHHAIRARLAPRHVFRTRSDTEVLVHLYEEMGDAMVDELRGMFAFAIWDDRTRRLTVARDRLGIKPLYYWQTADGVAFASELRSFLALEEFPREIDADAVREYLALGYVPDPSCIFRGVRKLPPAHVLIWSAEEGLSIRRFWTPVRPESPIADEREAVEELRRLLADAVASHLESDVRLGAFLSGGIDSSTVVAQMARLSGSTVETFSIGFEEPEFNEAPHAGAVARALGTKHTELIVRPEADALIEQLVRTFDEPFGDSSALPTMLVSELARQHVTVALSGDGGDELFGGYTRYGEMDGAREMSSPVTRRLVRAAAVRLPHSTFGRNRLLHLSRGRRGQYAGTVAHALPVSEGGVLTEVDEALSLDRLLDRWFDPAADRDFLTQMTLVDLGSYLPGDILTKVDRASMRVSLEARVPLLDHPLVEFAVSLPGRVKRRDGVGKWILRQAVTGLVPDSVFAQPKRGFGVPLAQWLRRELRHRLETLLRADRAVYEHVDRASVARLVNEHLAGRRDHSHFLWRLLVLDLWLAAFARGELARAL
ncbi:MAG: asparagine synthase (glutamine-hydrolyzing) [Gemmatimonadaceae bacterium]|nr:asparagine synthase (glutamine-hydrolyzing) [Gemmatimonadaceae bacterium]NUO96256.1 asparagine synthase (glutamine-hydrolyzing) [Gemmatimonadaceae bacterium]NUP70449.1 asparagine synthase (glutamine-hydrolyzing) [Gemmatimonadaceae bacterium]NUR33084.1 asparagine synthase (glutamine-hydrolyzing) [Gemmatimonadaceae bacterium]NUS32058.1 asparagine synthase (glutamine-hydrolyzing) [Gemmatimonadaceae bacterium]